MLRLITAIIQTLINMVMINKDEQYEQPWKLLVLSLKLTASKKGISHQQIADKTGMLRSNITRILSRKYCPSLHIFMSIAKAIGVNFFLEDKDNSRD